MIRRSRLVSMPKSAADRSRLSVVAGAPADGFVAACPPCSKPSVKKKNYSLEVTMVSPDQIYIDLHKDGKFVETLSELTAVDLTDAELDALGRINPSAIWAHLQSIKDYVAEKFGEAPSLPERHDIYQSSYTHETVHPRSDDG